MHIVRTLLIGLLLLAGLSLRAQAQQQPLVPRLGFTGLAVADLDRSEAFYTTILGLKVVERRDLATVKEVLLKYGAYGEPLLVLVYYKEKKEGLTGERFGTVGMYVIDAKAITQKVVAMPQLGGKIEREPSASEPGRPIVGFLRDPDGYRVEIIENPSPTSLQHIAPGSAPR